VPVFRSLRPISYCTGRAISPPRQSKMLNVHKFFSTVERALRPRGSGCPGPARDSEFLSESHRQADGSPRPTGSPPGWVTGGTSSNCERYKPKQILIAWARRRTRLSSTARHQAQEALTCPR
jgi:hypothetical protein